MVSKSGSGGTPRVSNLDYYNGDISFLNISDITSADGYVYKTGKKITEEGLNNSSAWIVPKESISLAMYASVGKLSINKIDLATSQAFFNMVFEDLSLRDFVYQRLVLVEKNHEWESRISTGTQKNLNASKVKDFCVFVPDISEVNSISKMFTIFDHTITLHQRLFLTPIFFIKYFQ